MGVDVEGSVDTVNGYSGNVTLTADDIETDISGETIQDRLDAMDVDISSKTSADGVSVVIDVSDWDGGTTCTKTVIGVTASNYVIVAPNPSSDEKCREFDVKAISQGSETLTFSASSTPDSSITMNILIVG